jgi:hypothetical protein
MKELWGSGGGEWEKTKNKKFFFQTTQRFQKK